MSCSRKASKYEMSPSKKSLYVIIFTYTDKYKIFNKKQVLKCKLLSYQNVLFTCRHLVVYIINIDEC
jgi:hypothetical protein